MVPRHFSVVLNCKRRLAYFTAIDIDGPSPKGAKQEMDRSFFDPRVAEKVQVGNAFYKGRTKRAHPFILADVQQVKRPDRVPITGFTSRRLNN